eukprot:121647_1
MIFLWSLAPFSVCWLWCFYILRNTKEIASRRPYSSMIAGILCIVGFVLKDPFVLAMYNTSFIDVIPYAPAITNTISQFTNIAPFHIFTYRAYMVYFDIKWNQAMEDVEWRTYIDANESNWFLKNKN